jgi:hypothetical protein
MCQLELTGRRILVPDAVNQHVPVAAQAVAKHIPHFWNFFGGQSSRSIWMEDDNHYSNDLRQRSCRTGDYDEEDDPVFRYYAEALQSALQSDADGAESYHNKNPMSCADYRRYYADLAVGRSVDRFHKIGSSSDLPLAAVSSRSDIPQWIQRVLVKGAMLTDRIRAATSLQIGGGGVI